MGNIEIGTLTVIDQKGEVLEVTDLPEAIRQADMFRYFRSKDSSLCDFNRRQQEYWNDLYQKLVGLHKQIETKSGGYENV